MSASLPTSGPANSVPPIRAAEPPQPSVGAQSRPPLPATSATHPVAAGAQNVGNKVPTPDAQTEQAAQLSDKSPTIDALAGGTMSPSPPTDEPPQKLRPSSRSAKARARKKKENHFDFRADADTTDRIFDRVELVGCTPSEAIRQLIEDGATHSPRIILRPRTPPQQLEAFIGALKAWRHAFQEVRSRLNAPMPENPEDQELIDLVRKWRATSEDLHGKINGLLDSAQAILKLLTSLTPERIDQLRANRVELRRWIKGREEKAVKAEKQKDRDLHRCYAAFYLTLVAIIDEMGIRDEEK